jgi:hypothetical protein
VTIANAYIDGIRIISSTQCLDYLPVGAPARTHRKKRVQKKWLKRYGRRYVEVPYPKLMQISPGVFVGHPDTIAKLQAEIAAEQTQAAHAAAAPQKGERHEEVDQAG